MQINQNKINESYCLKNAAKVTFSQQTNLRSKLCSYKELHKIVLKKKIRIQVKNLQDFEEIDSSYLKLLKPKKSFKVKLSFFQKNLVLIFQFFSELLKLKPKQFFLKLEEETFVRA